jgi:hypothetical protein
VEVPGESPLEIPGESPIEVPGECPVEVPGALVGAAELETRPASPIRTPARNRPPAGQGEWNKNSTASARHEKGRVFPCLTASFANRETAESERPDGAPGPKIGYA